MNRRQVAIGRGEPGAGRSLPGENAGACRRAKRTRGISAREGHSPLRESLEVWRLVKLCRAVERGVTPAEIIGDDEDDIGARRGWRSQCCRNDQHEEQERGFHSAEKPLRLRSLISHLVSQFVSIRLRIAISPGGTSPECHERRVHGHRSGDGQSRSAGR